MRNGFLALTIVALASGVFAALRHDAGQRRLAAAAAREACMTQVQALAQARDQLAGLQERLQNLKGELIASPLKPAARSSASLAALVGATRLSGEQSERMLAELGFNWHSTGEYVVVSKDILRALRLEAVRDFKLNDAACQLLAITPEEREHIDATTRAMRADCNAWVSDHARREEPHGLILAQYTLPEDPQFFQTLSNRFANSLHATLGRERAGLLLEYATEWMFALGVYGHGRDSVTVQRCERWPFFELNQSCDGSGCSGGASPFPAVFLPLFPNGWPDLARREGFELPAELQGE